MRDSNVSDALDRIMTGEKSTRSQGFTLCPHWLDRLMGRADAFEEPVALPIVDGSVAGFAKVQAQALKAHLRGDRNGAKNACWWLASQLADADRHLAEALGYGREALELGGEESWREQISRWLERVGAPREAASVLAPNVHVAAAASIAAKLLMRMARLQIRGGALQEAMENLLEAATVWPTSADALELAGELAAVQGESTATTMWLEAADRHDQNGNRARAFEARRRAFALSPASAQACDALVDTLEQSGRFQAADETRLLHANAIDGSASRAVHAIRLSRALEAEDSARALAVIVQGRLETVIAGSVAAQVDEALTQAGLHDAVTARWEWAASTEQGTSKARKLLDIAGIYLGRLASPDRALDAWIEAVAADPGCGEARASLRTHARAMRDDTPLVEALIRAVQANPHGPAAIGCYRELATLAEERLSDPSLAHWALTELLIRMDDPQLESTRAALVPRIKLQDNALASAATAVEQGNTEAKLEGWRRMASILRGRPQEIQRYIEVLTHLVRLDREQSRWWLDLERATVRCGRQDHFERMVLERLEDPIAPNEKLHWLVTLMTHAWRRGDPQSALSLAQRLTETLPGMRASHAHAWIAASATGDEELRALALEHLAPNLSASVRATMLSLAATQWEALGNQEQAQRLMWQAKEADEGAPELLRLIASHAARSKDPALLRSLEKLASIFVPTRENHATMTSLLSHAGNGDLAHAWARRWIELCPWDPEVAEQLLQTGVASTTEMHAAAILRVAACVFPTSDMERMLCGGLAELLSRDVHRAAQVAAELADMWGSHSEVFRETLLAVALEAQDLRREAKIVERWLAHTTAPRQELLRLAKIYGDLDDREGQALALVRAARASIEPHEILARLEPMQESISGDAALWILEARARCLAASGDTEGSALAWLHLGSARWDHAHDPVGAIEAWLEAMGHDALAFARLSESLAQRTTAEEVSDAFQDYALACTDPVRRACAFVVAAARAIGLERWTEAADLALQALREDPRRTDALTLIEVASGQGANHQAIDEAHRLAAAGAKGRFGKRASHLRAARVLEARGFSEMALTHAIAAFEADPMQGSALTIMQRLAQQENVADVVDCLCNVAENTQADQRALWWMQAATIASNHAQHQRRALDLGLRALLESPSVEAMELIGRVLESLLRVDKEESSIFELRLQRALKALAPKLEGPIGARIAVSAATISVIILNAYSLALQWARAALACSGDIDEYDRLVALVPQLVMDKEGCGLFIQELIQRVRDRSGTTGPSLMAFAHRLSEALGDGEWVRALRELEAETASDSSQPMDPFADLADAISVDSTPPEPTKSQPEQDPSPKEAISDSAVSSRDGAMPTGQTDRLALADELVERGQEREAIEVLERMGADTPNAQVDRRLRERYEALGLHERLVALLERMASQLDDPAEKVPLLVQVGALRDKLGDKEQARAMWNLVVEVAPETREAWLRLEQDAMERGEWELLAHLLQRHSTVTPSASEAQALQLRRVQLLDRSLMMSERAQGELDELIARGAANSAMLVYRAELAERLEGKLSAAGYWVRAAMLADDRSEAVPLLCGAARAYLDLGVYDKAQQALEQIGDVRTEQVLTLKLEAELGDSGPTARRGDLLDELSAVSNAQPSHRAGWLMEAAEIAMLKGDSHRALDRARRAAALVPSDTEIQLRVVFMTYRLEGLSDRRLVSDMLAQLRRIEAGLSPEDIDLHGFLTAECIEVWQGPDAAMTALQQQIQRTGTGPLLALALADRYSIMGDPHLALPLFDMALGAEDLRGVRTRAQVAFCAARAALRAGGAQLAEPYVALLEREPGSEPLVQRLRVEMTELVPTTDEVRRQLNQVARASRGLSRAQALWQLARISAARNTRESNAEAEGYYGEAIAAASSDATLRKEMEVERDAFRSRLTPSLLPPPARISTVPPAAQVPKVENEPSVDTWVSAIAPSPLSPPVSPSPADTAPVVADTAPVIADAALPPADATPSIETAAPTRPIVDPNRENKLLQELAKGNMQAGDELASWISDNPTRSSEVVAIRRRQVVLEPHSVRHLELLRDAARADRNADYAAALHHVVCVLTGQTAPPPPNLQPSSHDPERLLTMVGRGVYGAAADVLGEVWRSASHLFVREPAAYGLTGIERISLISPSPVGRAYAKAAGILGLGKVPVFQRRTEGAMALGVAALSPMAVVVSGEIVDGEPLEYRMAAMMMGTTPPNAMLFGLPPTAVRQLMRALQAAFGPPSAARERASESAVLAAELWRALPGSAQRRFAQLYRDSEPFSYEDAWARALQVTRRAGLLVVGNLAVALKDALSDPGMQQAIDTGAPDAYRHLCRVSVSAADLVRFAASCEYADVRWHDTRHGSGAYWSSTTGSRP